jgi:hypothetical protein
MSAPPRRSRFALKAIMRRWVPSGLGKIAKLAEILRASNAPTDFAPVPKRGSGRDETVSGRWASSNTWCGRLAAWRGLEDGREGLGQAKFDASASSEFSLAAARGDEINAFKIDLKAPHVKANTTNLILSYSFVILSANLLSSGLSRSLSLGELRDEAKLEADPQAKPLAVRPKRAALD